MNIKCFTLICLFSYKHIRTVIIVTTLTFLSCNRQQQHLKAKIFERRELSKNRLIIKYRYLTGNKIYTDTASVKNTIIGNDSINIIIDPSHPGKSLPDL